VVCGEECIRDRVGTYRLEFNCMVPYNWANIGGLGLALTDCRSGPRCVWLFWEVRNNKMTLNTEACEEIYGGKCDQE
jgi:hypothetical protein